MIQRLLDFAGSIVFSEPDKITLMSLVPALFFLVAFLWLLKVSNRPKKTYGSKYPLFGTFKFWGATVLMLVLMILALANPFIPRGNFTIKRGNAEVVFLIDYSSSMFLKDTGWARIDLAVREIMNLLPAETLKKGDRVSLFVFGGNTSRRLPLTTDLDSFSYELSLIGRPKTLIGDTVYWSSDIAEAFRQIYIMIDHQDMVDEFGKEVPGWQPKPKQNRLIFIFTDGADLLVSSGDKESDTSKLAKLNGAVKELNRRNIKIYPVGIGTRKGAFVADILKDYKPVEQYDPALVEELKGSFSALDVRGLEYLKNISGSNGPFLIENQNASAGNFLAAAIYAHRSAIIEPTLTNEKEELWPYFLMAALAVFLVGLGWYFGVLITVILALFIL